MKRAVVKGMVITGLILASVLSFAQTMPPKARLVLDEGALDVSLSPIGKHVLNRDVQSDVLHSNDQMSPVTPNGYLARIKFDSPEDVEKALLRAEMLYKEGKVKKGENPLAFVLHGPEVAIFLKDNYQKYQHIVDLAARLSAFDVVDVKVCRTRLKATRNGIDSLVPFVKAVPYGPAEIERLVEKEKYVYF